jgi:hypothetical protein
MIMPKLSRLRLTSNSKPLSIVMKNIDLSLSLRDEPGVWECAPPGFGDREDLVAGEGLPNARIDAFVQKYPHPLGRYGLDQLFFGQFEE